MIRPEHYRSYSAVFPILLRDGKDGREVLLHLRPEHPATMDGTWDFAGSGHVDENETARQAVARECRRSLASRWSLPMRNLSTCATGLPGATAAPITICASESGATAASPP